MLERLDKLEGVKASSANHAGTMIRVSTKTGADREKLATMVQKHLATANGEPVLLKDNDLKAALDNERWRTKEQIGELSAIEFRKLTLDRVRAFAMKEKLAEETAGKLIKMAEETWNQLGLHPATKEATTLPHKTDWASRCMEFAKVFREQSKELLTPDQYERLGQALRSRSE